LLALGDISTARVQVERLLAQGSAIVGPEIVYRGELLLARVAGQLNDHAGALAHYDAMTQALGTFVQELAYDRGADFLRDKDNRYMEALTTAIAAGESMRALRYLEQERARSSWLATSGDDAELERLRLEHRGISLNLSLQGARAASDAEAQEQLRIL